MRIIPSFPPTRIADVQPVRTLTYVLVLAVFLCVLGPLLVYPGVLLLLPACLLTVLVSVGPIGFTLCAVLCTIYAFGMGGFFGGACLLLAVIPALLVGAACIVREKPFFLSLLACFGALFIGALLALTLALWASEGQLSAVLAAWLESTLRASRHTDTLLLYGYMGGFLPLTDAITVPALALPGSAELSGSVRFLGSSVVLNPEAREELLRALLFRFESRYCRDVPGQLISGSILGTALLQTLPRRALRRHGCPIELPALRQWFLPAGLGRFIVTPMIVAFVLMSFMASGTPGESVYTYTSGAYITFSAFYQACMRLFSLQGLALLDEVLYQGGRSRAARTGFIAVCFVLLGQFAALFGMADQVFDFRHLRKPPEDKNDDDRQEDDF